MIKVRIFYVVLCLAMLANFRASAAESTKYNIFFWGEKSTIEFTKLKTQDGETEVVNIFNLRRPNDEKTYVDRYKPEGGSIPKIESVFVSGYVSRKLFIIVSWAADDPSIETGGTLYQVYVYDEKVENRENIMQLTPDLALTQRFGVGFDGIREGKRVTYRFKTAKLVKKQLADWGYR